MFSWVLLLGLLIGSAFGWESIDQESGECSDNFETRPNVHAHGAIRFDDVKIEDQCKARCLVEDECKAVDWNFVKVECWLHYAYDKPLEPDNKVNHYIKCSEDYNEWTAGFPIIDRNNYYATSYVESSKTGYPVILMAPPPGSPAAITKEATAQAFKLYIKAGNDFNSMVYVGVARPKEDGDVENLYTDRAYAFSMQPLPRDEPMRQEIDDYYQFQVQPGDMLWVSAHAFEEAHLSVPYDVGDPEICGASYRANYWEYARPPAPALTNFTAMSECWMMSMQLELKETP